jgi:haloacetate dehalogenase
MMLNNFEHVRIDINGVTVNLRHGGKGPPLLLLHGYPQTHVTWHAVADVHYCDARLARLWRLFQAGRLAGPQKLFQTHDGAGHGRCNAHAWIRFVLPVRPRPWRTRVASPGVGSSTYREKIDGDRYLTDPTRTMYEATSQAFASAYYHWFFLIQPHPLPETLIGGNASYYLK